MARKLRVEFPDAIYNITHCGNGRMNIFKDASPLKRIDSKIKELLVGELIIIGQNELLANPDSRLHLPLVEKVYCSLR